MVALLVPGRGLFGLVHVEGRGIVEDGRIHVLMSLLAIYNENDSGQLSHTIAEYLLTHFESIGSMSLQEVMDAGFVSRSGLRRFCQSIGMDNFSSLRNQAGEWEEFRHYYLAAASPSSEYQVPMRQAMVEIFDSVDRLRESGALRRLSRLLGDSDNVVLFSAESSAGAVTDFQYAMLVAGKLVQLVTESNPSVATVKGLGPGDLLLVVSSSGSFAMRQKGQVEASGARKVLVTANDNHELHAPYDEVVLMGPDLKQRVAPHRVYALFGTAYLMNHVLEHYVAGD